MNGLTKMLLGVWWVGCAIYTFIILNVETSIIGVVGNGVVIVIMAIVGLVLVWSGTEQYQRGE